MYVSDNDTIVRYGAIRPECRAVTAPLRGAHVDFVPFDRADPIQYGRVRACLVDDPGRLFLITGEPRHSIEQPQPRVRAFYLDSTPESSIDSPEHSGTRRHMPITGTPDSRARMTSSAVPCRFTSPEIFDRVLLCREMMMQSYPSRGEPRDSHTVRLGSAARATFEISEIGDTWQPDDGYLYGPGCKTACP